MKVESRLGRVITGLTIVVMIAFMIMAGIVQMCTSRDVGVSSIAKACEDPTPPEPTGTWVISDESPASGSNGTWYVQPTSDDGMYTRALGPDIAWPDDVWATASNEGSYNNNVHTAYARMGYNGFLNSNNPYNGDNNDGYNNDVSVSKHTGIVELLEIDPAKMRGIYIPDPITEENRPQSFWYHVEWPGNEGAPRYWDEKVWNKKADNWQLDQGPTFGDTNELHPSEIVKRVHWVGEGTPTPITLTINYHVYTWGGMYFGQYEDWGHPIRGLAEVVADNQISFRYGNGDWITRTQVRLHMAYDGGADTNAGGWQNHGHKDMMTASDQYRNDPYLTNSGFIVNTIENTLSPSSVNSAVSFSDGANSLGDAFDDPNHLYSDWDVLDDHDPGVQQDYWGDSLSFPGSLTKYSGYNDIHTNITNGGYSLGGSSPSEFRYKASRQVGVGVHIKADERSIFGNVSASAGGDELFQVSW